MSTIASLAIRRDVFEALDGFNREYSRSQDRELTVRLLLTGRTGMYVPGMVAGFDACWAAVASGPVSFAETDGRDAAL